MITIIEGGWIQLNATDPERRRKEGGDGSIGASIRGNNQSDGWGMWTKMEGESRPLGSLTPIVGSPAAVPIERVQIWGKHFKGHTGTLRIRSIC